jgi:hypothetical protein
VQRQSIIDEVQSTMLKHSILQRLGQWLAVAAMLSFMGLGSAMAQAEPTVKQIYETAQSGKLDQAQVMIQQVLISHPDSARAHFVQAELFARQGLQSRGQESLAKAEKLAPGLPFAKPEAVQALRTQLASKPVPAKQANGSGSTGGSGTKPQTAAPAPSSSSFPLGLGLALGGGAIALAIFLMRKKPAAPVSGHVQAAYPAYPTGSGLSGPQTFGSVAGGAAPPAYGQGYGQQGYGQQGYGQQPAAPGMGSRLMGGLATGVAVGAGLMAAQAIGKNLMGNNEQEGSQNLNDGASGTGHDSFSALPGNADMGGQNFGLNDASSWDDGGGSADLGGGGGDWDT